MRANWALAACLLLAAAPVAAQEVREFRDWRGSCDAQRACHAETGSKEGARDDYLLRITRRSDEPGWNLVLVANAAHPERPYNIYFGLIGDSVDAAAFGRDSDLHLLGQNATRLLEAMGPATEAVAEFTDAAGNPFAPRFALSGLSASLLWIDEMQERVGSPRVAGAAPQGLPALEFGALGDGTLPADLLVLHGNQDDCDGFDIRPVVGQPTIVELNQERTLYLIPCTSGAYNFVHAAYIGEGRRYRREWFADYSHDMSWTATPFLVNPHWDEANGRLTTLNKQRGIGDCGSIGEWRALDGQLRLEKFYYKGDCDGEGGPDSYPLVFEAPRLP